MNGAHPVFAPPTYARPLVGRRELVESIADLVRPGARLVTLVGAPGVGKTRVGAAVARAVDPGASWVDLAPLVTRADVVSHVARALGLEVDAAVDEAATLTLLAEQPLAVGLVVLDNCEHVSDAVAEIVAGLVRRPSGPAVLATSRVRLGLDPEHVVVVPPLDEAAAVELLLARAGARGGGPIQHDDAAAIVRVLDGVPLALELAAARTRVLDGRSLRDRLEQGIHLLHDAVRDRPARHRSLDAALDGSFQLLDPGARRTLGGLACFSGSFTAAAAATVLGEGPDAAVDVLDALVDHSLLHVERDVDGTVRFRMFEALRQFAVERLPAADREAFRRRLATYAAEEGARLSDWSTVLDEPRVRRLSLEQGNLRAVLGELGPRATTSADAALCVQAAAALGSLFFARGPWSEALAVLDVSGTAWFPRAPRAARAELLWKRGFVEAAAEAFDAARADLEAAARLVDAGSVRDGVLRTLATLERERGTLGAARRHADTAVSEAFARRDPIATSLALATLSEVAQAEGKLDEAIRAIDDAIRVEVEELRSSVPALYRAQRASVLQEQGRLSEARAILEEVVADVRARGLRAYLARFLADLGASCLEAGDLGAAAHTFEEARSTSTTASIAVFSGVGLAVIAALGGPATALAPPPRRGPDPVVELGAAIVAAARGEQIDVGALLAATLHRTPRVRCLQRILHGRLPRAEATADTLRVDARGRGYVRGGTAVDVARRPVLGRLLLALVRGHLSSPGAVVDAQVLVDAVWPGERLARKVAQNRLQVAIHDLRATGLKEQIESHPGGYRLDPATRVVVEPGA